jgi:hypothetical protein
MSKLKEADLRYIPWVQDWVEDSSFTDTGEDGNEMQMNM